MYKPIGVEVASQIGCANKDFDGGFPIGDDRVAHLRVQGLNPLDAPRVGLGLAHASDDAGVAPLALVAELDGIVAGCLVVRVERPAGLPRAIAYTTWMLCCSRSWLVVMTWASYTNFLSRSSMMAGAISSLPSKACT
jgi:hypothetical protein